MTRKVSNLLKEYFDYDRPVRSVQSFPAMSSLGRSSMPISASSFEWQVHKDPERFHRRFKFDSRNRTISFVSEVLSLEDEINHHGEIRIDNTEVDVSVYTHDVNRITELDREYVKHVDNIYRDVLDFEYR